MTRGKSSRSQAEARGGARWWVAGGAVAIAAACAALALGLLELPPSSDTEPSDAVQLPEDTASPERVAATGRESVDTTSVSITDTTGAQVARDNKTARISPPAPKIASKLALFYAALSSLEGGSTAAPVTILHLGDSHIASDRITGEVRRLMQARFGDGGRGLMMPGFPFPYYKAPGFTFEKTGKWTAANSLNEDGAYGITGVSLTGTGVDAVLKLASTSGPFALPEVSLLASPGGGHAVISAGSGSQQVATAGDSRSVLRVKLRGNASSLAVKVVGDGPVTVLGWSVASGRPGVRYVNLGIPSASALTTRRFDRGLAASDIAALAPKLVVLGYGTNEGFNDDLDFVAYEKEYVRLIELVKATAPDATLLILGPTDGTRLPRFVKGDARAAAPCRPLGGQEREAYNSLLAREDGSLARWHEPPELAAVRSLLARIAGRYGATYWDLSAVMGGPCSIDRWAKGDPPLALPDHVHLSDEGSRRVGRAIYDALIRGYDRYREQADAGGSFGAGDIAVTAETAPERVAGP